VSPDLIGAATAMDMQYGFLGLIVLALDIWAIVSIARSHVDSATKLVWIFVIVLLPAIGLVLWLAIGPRGARIRL
jgi:hypothetical protein